MMQEKVDLIEKKEREKLDLIQYLTKEKDREMKEKEREI